MKVLVDSREQKPLDFIGLANVDLVEVRGLSVGDYCVEYKNGWIPPIVFERKSIGDLYGTMGKGYPRFKKEIERAREKDTEIILIVEGNMSKVLKGHKYSKIKGESIIKKLFTLLFRYHIMPVFCKDRKEMARWIIEYYSGIGREAIYDLKKGVKGEK